MSSLPAIQAVIKQAILPATRERIANLAKSFILEGHIAPIPPTVIPTDPTFEKPQRAYVAMTSERNCTEKIWKIIIFNSS